jgi:hypothetical protein
LLLCVASCSAAPLRARSRRWRPRAWRNSLTSGPDVFGTDDDPQLIREAIPFGLKTMESLLQTLPEHRGLLLGLCQGFTRYGVAFVQADADEIETWTMRRRAPSATGHSECSSALATTACAASNWITRASRSG